MEYKELTLTEEEKNKISKTAKQNKFPFGSPTLIYKEGIDKLDLFINAMRFLHHLQNIDFASPEDEFSKDLVQDAEVSEQEVKDSSQEFKEIKQKIKSFIFLNEVQDIYQQALSLKNKNLSKVNFGKHTASKLVDNFIQANKYQINYILDYVYELGKKTQYFDPEQTQGYY